MKVLEEKTFRLRGKKISIGPEEAHALLESTEGVSSRGKNPKYFVVVGKRRVPVKSAFETILRAKGIDLTVLDFTTQDAVRILRKLGFHIVRGKCKKEELRGYIGALSMEGNAVKDKEKAYNGSL